MRTGFDIDGVCYDWHYCLYRYFCEFKGFSGSERQFWTYFHTLDRDAQNYYVSLPHLYLNMSMRPTVKKALELLSNTSEIFYITAREESLRWVTRKFFDTENLPFKENVIFAPSKAEYVRLLGIKYFIDDMPRHVNSLQGITNAYLLCVPHNFDQREGFNTVSSVKEFVDIVLGADNG